MGKKRFLHGFGVLLGIAGLTLALSLSAFAADKKVESEEDAKEFLTELLSGDAASLSDTYALSNDFSRGLKRQGGFKQIQNSLKRMGEYVGMGDISSSENDGMTVYRLPISYSIQSFDFALTIDDGEVAGLYLAPYTGGEDGDESVDSDQVRKLSIPVTGHKNWSLPAFLWLPEGDGPFPLVILIHGSGPNDRDESVGKCKPFRDIAEGLAEKGIATLRYDKRTFVYGREMTQGEEVTLKEEVIDDVLAALSLAKEQEEVDKDQIYLAGHSLGGMALPRIAKEVGEGEVAGYIFLAAPARGLGELMVEQNKFLLSLRDTPEDMVEKETEELDKELEKLSNLSDQPEDEPIFGALPVYWEYLEGLNQVEEGKEIDEPCLFLQGDEDYQVSVEDDFEVWKDALGGKGNVTFTSLEGLTHLFTEGKKSDGPLAYQQKAEVADAVIDAMAEFVGK